MREYTFIGKTSEGKRVSEDLYATSEKEALAILHKKGYTVIQIDLLRRRSLYDRLFRRARTELKVLIFRQMSTMLASGISMQRVLAAISKNEGMPSHFQRALQKIALDVHSGYSLSQALRLFPEYFTPFMIGSIRIGEVSGQLAETMEHCAEYLNNEYAYNLKLRQAMIYPTVLMSCLAILLTYCFIYMLPIFISLFGEVQVDMPWPTKVLISCTDYIHQYGWRIFCTLIGPIGCGIYLFNRWRQTLQGNLNLERWILRIPWYGRQVHLRMQSSYLRSLGTLIDSSVSLMSSLDLLTVSLDYELLRLTAKEQMKAIQNGDSLTSSLRRSGLFQPLTLEMVHMGEETALVPQTLHRLAKTLDEEMNQSLQMLSKLIEPIILGILGVGITFILMAVFLPIYSLAQSF
ncbi:MAG: type II secretion system F family protein [bacterium]|nr:type II secretion system F family protein [bacterium]